MVGFLAGDLDPKVHTNACQGFLDEAMCPCLAHTEEVTDFLHGELFDEAKREHCLKAWRNSTDRLGDGFLSHIDELFKRVEFAWHGLFDLVERSEVQCHHLGFFNFLDRPTGGLRKLFATRVSAEATRQFLYALFQQYGTGAESTGENIQSTGFIEHRTVDSLIRKR